MKEATGELNLTIIVVIAIGILVAFFYYAIWPSLNTNLQQNSKCAQATCTNPCCPSGDASCLGKTTCSAAFSQKLVKCEYKDKKGNSYDVYCPWKG